MFAPEPGCGTKHPPRPPSVRPEPVAIVTAIPEEFDAIANRVSDGQRRRWGNGRGGFLLKGTMAGASVRLGMTGDGAARASRSLQVFLEEIPVSLLVGAGVAGALVPSLRAGDLVVSRRLIDEAGEVPPPDASFVARTLALGAKPATFVTVAGPLTSSRQKEDLAERVGASDSALAVVDMESAAWARAAASRGVPYVILRAISDTFDEELPAFLSNCLGSDGSIDRAAVARRLLIHPGALPALLAMRRRVVIASEGLGHFLARFLAASS